MIICDDCKKEIDPYKFYFVLIAVNTGNNSQTIPENHLCYLCGSKIKDNLNNGDNHDQKQKGK